MQESQVTIEATAHFLPMPFMVLATQKIRLSRKGTYPLPGKRSWIVLLKIRIDYPTLAEEAALVRSVTANNVGDKLNVESVSTMWSNRKPFSHCNAWPRV
jgi:MoxR-like ATPase